MVCSTKTRVLRTQHLQGNSPRKSTRASPGEMNQNLNLTTSSATRPCATRPAVDTETVAYRVNPSTFTAQSSFNSVKHVLSPINYRLWNLGRPLRPSEGGGMFTKEPGD